MKFEEQGSEKRELLNIVLSSPFSCHFIFLLLSSSKLGFIGLE